MTQEGQRLPSAETEVIKPIHHAVILAGGKGSRLGELTATTPKSLIPVNGRPIIDYQLEQLRVAGVDHITLAVGHHQEKLVSHIGSGDHLGIQPLYSFDSGHLGRGGAIKKALYETPGDWQHIVVVNGDSFIQVNIPEVLRFHTEYDALATVVVTKYQNPYGVVEIGETDQILAFVEKPISYVNTGLYVFSREIESLLPDMGDHEVLTFPHLSLDFPERFKAFKTDGYYFNINTPEDLAIAERELRDREERSGE